MGSIRFYFKNKVKFLKIKYIIKNIKDEYKIMLRLKFVVINNFIKNKDF